jgi:hypothetical protein
MYLVYCSLAFLCFYLFLGKNRAWLSLSILSLALWCNKSYFDNTDSALYILRAVFTTVTALYLVVHSKSKLHFYQAFILIVILAAYLALSYDVSQQKHILIYNKFEDVIHGLVLCQFAGVFPDIWRRIVTVISIHFSSGSIHNRVEKA